MKKIFFAVSRLEAINELEKLMTSSVSFDRAADYYDATPGLPPEASEQVTNSILEMENHSGRPCYLF